MPVVNTPTQTSAYAGTQLNFVAANQDGGHAIPNGDRDVLLIVRNTGANARNVIVAVNTAKRFRAADGQFPASVLGDFMGNVAPNSTRVYGPFPDAYNDDNGNIRVTFNNATDLTIAAIRPFKDV